MVFQKRSDSESRGHRGPTLPPRVPKSAKGKRSARKKVQQNEMRAIDLLATVAGELLEERDNYPSNPVDITNLTSNTVKETFVKENPSPDQSDESLDQDSCNESPDSPLELPSDPIKELLTVVCTENGYDSNKSSPGVYITMDPMDLDVKPPPLVSSDSSAEVPPYKDQTGRSSSFLKGTDGINLFVHRDHDDDESSGCTHPNRTFSPTHCTADRNRVKKKVLSSKFRKSGAARILKGENSYSDGERKKSALERSNLFYTRQRTQRGSFKRRNLFGHCSVITPEREREREREIFSQVGSDSAQHATSLGVAVKREPSNDRVQLKIKSFKIPALLIEISETATVASLKRKVLDAVNAVLAEELHVGVLVHGKRVRDDNRTLVQAGISQEERAENLGFILEPKCPQASEVSHLTDNGDITEPLARIPTVASPTENPILDANPKAAIFPASPNCNESDHDSVPSSNFLLPDRDKNKKRKSENSPNLPDSRAIVVAESVMEVEALAVVPARKLKRADQMPAQRRIRRPFSVSEVEALVHAVEKLGTGRWRDVKIRAFDSAKHRTYVDLKDKWKTLVHTASIAPNQRRGEPVPQELLDRVLAAQSYWSNQTKLHLKSSPLHDTCLLTN